MDRMSKRTIDAAACIHFAQCDLCDNAQFQEPLSKKSPYFLLFSMGTCLARLRDRNDTNK